MSLQNLTLPLELATLTKHTPPAHSTDAELEAQMIKRFRDAWLNFSPNVRAGIKAVIADASRREHDHQARMVLDFLNSKRPGKRGFLPVDANLRLICARLDEGISVNDLRAIIAVKVRQADEGTFSPAFLRPATLFNATKCAQYLGELGKA